MRFVAKTDVGKRRKNNEDSFFAKIFDKDLALFIVADGLGGYEGGEIASNILVKKFSGYIEESKTILLNANEQKIKNILNVALLLSNDEIYKLEKTDEKYKGMGTTIVAVLQVKNKLFYLSVGDSRIYYILPKNAQIEQITIDDTYVNELIRTNVITEEEAKIHPQKHVLTKAVGIMKNISASINLLDKVNGFLLLCSDGVTNMLSTDELLNLFHKNSLDNLADKIIDTANEKGGIDNITAIVVEL
ncbi:MAG: Stp1/IreP family PP2C-type Ser/Thr phosphatase [Clostridia bacterium]|nr:Stp1/IreP family PP2C-type Ser/Thr phosphatase [Clostridia bacterium]